MVRRTKQEAQETRHHILDMAERVFLEKGVSGTTLDDIAASAGVTRGAIYWHFKNKADLFDAVMQRVSLPLEEVASEAELEATDPIDFIRLMALQVVDRLVNDPQCRRVQEICNYKVEYVGDLEPLRERHIECCASSLALIEKKMKFAQDKGLLDPDVDPKLAAVGLHSLVVGLIQNWLLDPNYMPLKKTARTLVDNYLNGVRRPVNRKRTPKRKPRAVAAS